MKFKTGDLIEFDELRVFHRFHRPRLHLRLTEKAEGIRNLGVVIKCHCHKAYPNCCYDVYDVFWHRIGESCTVFENEIKIPD